MNLGIGQHKFRRARSREIMASGCDLSDVPNTVLLRLNWQDRLVAYCTANGHFVFVTPFSRMVFGTAPLSLIGRNIVELLRPEDCESLLSLSTTNVTPSTCLVRIFNGKLLWAETELSAMTPRVMHCLDGASHHPTSFIFDRALEHHLLLTDEDESESDDDCDSIDYCEVDSDLNLMEGESSDDMSDDDFSESCLSENYHSEDEDGGMRYGRDNPTRTRLNRTPVRSVSSPIPTSLTAMDLVQRRFDSHPQPTQGVHLNSGVLGKHTNAFVGGGVGSLIARLNELHVVEPLGKVMNTRSEPCGGLAEDWHRATSCCAEMERPRARVRSHSGALYVHEGVATTLDSSPAALDTPSSDETTTRRGSNNNEQQDEGHDKVHSTWWFSGDVVDSSTRRSEDSVTVASTTRGAAAEAAALVVRRSGYYNSWPSHRINSGGGDWGWFVPVEEQEDYF